MREREPNDESLRQFLLGTIDDETRQIIESLVLIDSELRERVLAAEQQLIDDYLEDCLSPTARKTFVSVYGDTPAQRRKLRIAKTIQEWAVNQQPLTKVRNVASTSLWNRFRKRFLFRPVAVIPVTMAMVVVVIAAVWVNNRKKEQYPHSPAIQEELAQLNAPSSLREYSPEMPQLIPGSVRSVDPQAELVIGPSDSVAELRLVWLRKNYPVYQAVLRRTGDDQSYTIPNLTAEKEGGKFIRVRFPARILISGNYQIELCGISHDGDKSPSDIYSFTVSR